MRGARRDKEEDKRHGEIEEGWGEKGNTRGIYETRILGRRYEKYIWIFTSLYVYYERRRFGGRVVVERGEGKMKGEL